MISGSNGSGKTNVLQAVAFVLNSGRLLEAASDEGYINREHRTANPGGSGSHAVNEASSEEHLRSTILETQKRSDKLSQSILF